MNLHQLRRAWFPCLLPILVAGCSSTMGSRFGSAPQPQPKSIAVVGDRTVSVATGEPGSKVVAQADPEPKPNPKGRISGRVLDDHGEPVANATVRLADGGTKGGKDVRGITDKTGAFTLNGLRPGSTYSLVAEDEEGTLSGRITAKTTDSRVEITVLTEEAEAKAARKGRPAKARPISNREEVDEEPATERKPSVNREDVESPAEQADGPDPGPSSEAGRPQLIPPQATTAWQTPKAAKKAKTGTEDADAVATSGDERPRRSRVSTAKSVADDEEEGPNPLPPAIESDQADEPAPRKPTSARLKPTAKPKPRPPVESPDSGAISLAPETTAVEKLMQPRSLPTSPLPTDLAAAELPMFGPAGPPVDEKAAATLPEPVAVARAEAVAPASAAGPPDLPPVGLATVTTPLASAPPGPPPAGSPTTTDVPPTNPATQPVFASPAPAKPTTPASSADYNPFALVAATSAVAVPTSTVDSGRILDPAKIQPVSNPIVASGGSDLAAPSTAGPKTKWGDLAGNDPKPIPTTKVEPTKATLASAFVKRFRPSPAAEKVDTSVAQCSYDARLLRIKDFRLPDLEGKPVRFQDLGADFVLLDFWGTWCSPCMESIPHLIELQKKYGPTRLKVVGIACEEVAPELRRAKVAEVARKMGINYPILLSTMDGKPCPVQQALAVQAMPTMILVDRKGQVIWRSTGSTMANETRLDRVLATKLGASETVRR